MSALGDTSHRALAVICGTLSGPQSSSAAGTALFTELSALAASSPQVQVLHQPSQEQLRESTRQHQPLFVYICQQLEPDTQAAEPDSLALLQDSEVLKAFTEPTAASETTGHLPEALYIDAVVPDEAVAELRKAGVQHIIHWSSRQVARQTVADHFVHAFHATLQVPGGYVSEAFALASHACHVHLGKQPGEGPGELSLPMLQAAHAPALPSHSTIPLPQVEGKDFANGVGAAIADWDDVRLLAPHAELRLLACGQPSLICPERLTHLGEALRALLVLEVRHATLKAQAATQKAPAHLPPGCSAVCCDIQTASGAEARVVLGAPEEVLKTSSLVEFALRQTLVADAMSLQFKLPPAGVPLPAPHTSPEVAWGAPVVHTLVVTSVWVIQVLRSLCQDSHYKLLPALGIAAVGCTNAAAMTHSDAVRLTAMTQLTASAPDLLEPLQPPMNLGSGLLPQAAPLTVPAGPPLGPLSSNVLPPQQLAAEVARRRIAPKTYQTPSYTGAGRGRPRKDAKIAVPEAAAAPWVSNRPPLAECSKEELLDDIRRFLEHRRGRVLLASSFPEAVLNGKQLDINAMYRTVCHRGGFAADSTMNWGGKVFPEMANWADSHKMTGVGSALKRHYQGLLLDYELAHPQDVNNQASE